MPIYAADSASFVFVTPKDPSAVVDYAFDWSAWLEVDETINSYTVTTQAGLTLDSDSEDSGVVTAWLSGGTAGTSYTNACRITTSAGRTDERTMVVRVVHR